MKTNTDNQNGKKCANGTHVVEPQKQETPLDRRLRMLHEMKKEEIIEENGVVIYDNTDDYDPAEDEEIECEGNFPFKTNEEIFTDEYMRDFASKMDAKIAREKRQQKMISVGVVLGSLIIAGLFCVYAYLKYFH